MPGRRAGGDRHALFAQQLCDGERPALAKARPFRRPFRQAGHDQRAHIPALCRPGRRQDSLPRHGIQRVGVVVKHDSGKTGLRGNDGDIPALGLPGDAALQYPIGLERGAG